MARQKTPVGQHGDVRTYYFKNGHWHARSTLGRGAKPDKWRAITSFRVSPAKLVRVEKTGTSETKAKAALATYCDELADPYRLAHHGENVTVADLSKQFLKRVRKHRADTTYDRYETRIRVHILPGLGEDTKVHECTTPVLEAFLESLGEATSTRKALAPGTQRGIKATLSEMFRYAVTKGPLRINPAAALSPIESDPDDEGPQAFTVDELRGFLLRLDEDALGGGPGTGRQTNHRDRQLPALLRFLFLTGCRIGEALALRWRDVNLSNNPVKVDGVNVGPKSLRVSGNIVEVRGKPLQRHQGKTFASRRNIGMSEILQELLTERRPDQATPDEPVFPSANLGYRHPCNVQRSVRRMRDRIGYPHFHTHMGRSTVTDILYNSDEQTLRDIATWLGHTTTVTLQRHYLPHGPANASAPRVLDAAHRFGKTSA